MRMHRLAPLALLLVSPVAAAGQTRLPLTVRVYDMTGDHADRHRAFEAATRALAPAVVEVHWIDGRAPDAGAPASQDLVLRLVRADASAPPTSGMALGYAVIDAAGRRGTVATIFLDRADRLAHISGADVQELTGLAIAHEIGHLLLGTTAHTRHGLMRARWTADEVRERRPLDWQLGVRERTELRAGLAARLGTRAGTVSRLSARATAGAEHESLN